jgi:hypothetical protein
VFHTTFNNISAISWQSVLMVEESGVPRENHRSAASHWQTLSHNVVSRIHTQQVGVDLIITNKQHSYYKTLEGAIYVIVEIEGRWKRFLLSWNVLNMYCTYIVSISLIHVNPIGDVMVRPLASSLYHDENKLFPMRWWRWPLCTWATRLIVFL